MFIARFLNTIIKGGINPGIFIKNRETCQEIIEKMLLIRHVLFIPKMSLTHQALFIFFFHFSPPGLLGIQRGWSHESKKYTFSFYSHPSKMVKFQLHFTLLNLTLNHYSTKKILTYDYQNPHDESRVCFL